MQPLLFATQADFRNWLIENAATSGGVWLTFGKKGGPKTLSGPQALQEALCFGWIDGQMKRIDDLTYIKYFAPRRKGSEWSQKNIALVETLEAQGLMTPQGRAAIAHAQATNTFRPNPRPVITPEQIEHLTQLVLSSPTAYANFQAMPPSIKRTYAMHYFDAKSDETRARRLSSIVDRLERNLKPM